MLARKNVAEEGGRRVLWFDPVLAMVKVRHRAETGAGEEYGLNGGEVAVPFLPVKFGEAVVREAADLAGEGELDLALERLWVGGVAVEEGEAEGRRWDGRCGYAVKEDNEEEEGGIIAELSGGVANLDKDLLEGRYCPVKDDGC